MTEDQQRIAIAEACGWKRGKWTVVTLCTGESMIADGWVNPETEECDPESPDYLNDLNAMHEAEKVFDSAPIDEQSKYLDYLYCTVGWDESRNAIEAKHKCYYGSVRSTARQRAEAFLKAKNLWIE